MAPRRARHDERQNASEESAGELEPPSVDFLHRTRRGCGIYDIVNRGNYRTWIFKLGAAGVSRNLTRYRQHWMDRDPALASDLGGDRETTGKATGEVSAKSAEWKVAVATVLKERTTASNRWLAEHREMGSMFTVSRLTAECRAGKRAERQYRR